MRTTDELKEVVVVIVEKLKELGVILDANGITLCTYFPDSKDVLHWIASPDFSHVGKYLLPYFDHVIFKEAWESKKQGDSYFSKAYSIEDKNSFFEYAFKHSDYKYFPEEFKQWIFNNDKHVLSFAWQNNSALLIPSNTGVLLTDDEKEILIRFSKVFEQAYIRFMDLQKAEAQAREAKIEAALEKIRSRTMAMQKGEEVKDVVVLLYKELIKLGVTNFATCGYVEINEDTKRQETWVTSPGGDSLGLFYLPLTGDAHFDQRYEAWKKQQTVFHQTVAGKERKKHLEYAITTFNSKEAEEMVLTQFPDPTVFYCFNFSHGYLHLVSGSYLKEEEEALLARFTKVFEQTYARFLDLKKAEAQTRDAQINLAVERVRAKALAMHKSEEIIEVVAKLKDEVMGLDIPDVVAATIFLNEGDDKVRMWDLSSLDHEDNYLEIPFDLTFKIKKTDPHLYIKRVWENPENYFVEVQDEKDFKRLMQWLRELNKNELADEVEDFIEKTQLKRLYHSAKKLNNGKLVIDQLNPPTDEMETILTKMGAAFDLAYKRFEDLKNAEAQAREAQIEAALEKVRSRTMAMQHSDELPEAANNLFLQVQALGIPAWSAGYCIWKDESKKSAWCNMSSEGEIQKGFSLPTIGEGYDFYEPLQKKQDFYVAELGGEALVKHYDFMKKLPIVGEILVEFSKKGIALPTFQIFHIVFFTHGYLMFITYETVPNEWDIFKRFGKVFEQTYTRFLDLQKAEAQARESQIEAGLERVRSRTLAMQNSDELAETSMIVFQQLIDLGIAPNRLFIGIIKDEGASLEAWATNEDGSKIASQFTLQASKNKSIKKMLTGWKQHKKSLVIDMKGKELEDYFHYLNEDMKIPFIDGLKQKRRVQTIAYFSGGLIGMAAPDEQSEDSIRLLERFASVFNLTYTRFNDLKIAEAQAKKAEEDLINLQLAKKRAEEALSELQLTQTQLIQSEKMASLGELTAGIAHEIQNPLNFVNNFSEVSKELLDEMLEEIENGDMEEVKAIMDDVIQNLEKINHHGKRADGIVKGMLQHSRSSTGTKEAVNINTLADEYLRLAYHGLRAKDKSFNATLVTDFDDTIANIKIIPQDIGRVVLNLLTNAFYAVNEKKQSHKNGYEPTVTLTTKKNGNKVTISVKDNGNGIPQKVVDKIFQPFFTTKPTGQGTGLGLSMSYDIVTKGHGGELKVNTKQGEGTEFSIILPIKS
jgi:signal transduction histidine kinase